MSAELERVLLESYVGYILTKDALRDSMVRMLELIKHWKRSRLVKGARAWLIT